MLILYFIDGGAVVGTIVVIFVSVLQIIHGDIKSQNVLLTGWDW